jgi:hypothetical protein
MTESSMSDRREDLLDKVSGYILRKRTEAAFREMMKLLALVVQSRTNYNRPRHSKSHRRNERLMVIDGAAAVT